MNIWWVLLAGGLITFAMRFSFIYLFGKIQIPNALHRALRYVPPAVLSAIIFPEILIITNEVNISWQNPRLLAGLIAIGVVWFSHNTILTIVVGMGSFFLLQFFTNYS